MVETRPTFSRITEGRSGRSWRAALPVVLVLVGVLALIAYLASSISSSSQRAMSAQRDAQQAREQMEGMGKQIANLQKDNAIAKSPGRTTVLLAPAAPAEKPGKKGKAAPAAATGPWASATWGELPDGKTFMRVNAYGLLEQREGGKEFHAWFKPQSGDPVDLGSLEIDPNGSGFTMATNLPRIDQGKQVLLTADAQGAKTPGDVLASADLPKLTPGATAPPSGETPQAKSGAGSQPMHQQEK